MKQQGTHYSRIKGLFLDVWHTAHRLGNQGTGFDGTQRELTISCKIQDLCEFLDIEFVNGEIVSIAGKEVA